MVTMDLSVNQELLRVQKRYETEYGGHVFTLQEPFKETDITGNNNFFNSLKTETSTDHSHDSTTLFQVDCEKDKEMEVENSLFSYSSFKKAMDLRIHNRTVDGGKRTIFEDAEYFSRNCCYKLLPITFEQVDEMIIHTEHNYSLFSVNSESEPEEDCSRTMDYSQIREKNYKKRRTKCREVVDEEEVDVDGSCKEDLTPEEENSPGSLEQENPFIGQPLDLSVAPVVQEDKTEALGREHLSSIGEEVAQADSDKENVSGEVSGIRVTITRPDEKENYQPCDLFLNDIARLVPWLIDKDCLEVDILDRTCDRHEEFRKHRLYYVIAESTWRSFQSTNERVILTNDHALGQPLRKAEREERPSYLVFDQLSLAKCLAEYCQEIGGCFEYRCVEEEERNEGESVEERSGALEEDGDREEKVLGEPMVESGGGGVGAPEGDGEGEKQEWKEEGLTDVCGGLQESEVGEAVGEVENEAEGEVEGEVKGKVKGEVKSEVEGEAEGKVEGEAQGKVEGEAEGKVEGEAEGEVEGEAEGEVEGKAEGEVEGKAEGVAEGEIECKAEGEVEGKAEGEVEGKAEGVAEGEAEGEVEGKAEGVAEGEAEGQVEGKAESQAEGGERKAEGVGVSESAGEGKEEERIEADEGEQWCGGGKGEGEEVSGKVMVVKKVSDETGRRREAKGRKREMKSPTQLKPKDCRISTRSKSTSESRTSQKSDKRVSKKEGRKRRDITPPKEEVPNKRRRTGKAPEMTRSKRIATMGSEVKTERTRKKQEKKENGSQKEVGKRERREQGKKEGGRGGKGSLQASGRSLRSRAVTGQRKEEKGSVGGKGRRG